MSTQNQRLSKRDRDYAKELFVQIVDRISEEYPDRNLRFMVGIDILIHVASNIVINSIEKGRRYEAICDITDGWKMITKDFVDKVN